VAKVFKKRGRSNHQSNEGNRLREPGNGLPETTLVLITGTDTDGDPVGRPEDWNPTTAERHLFA